MKPRNKFQRYIVAIDKSIQPITPRQRQTALKRCLMHLGVRLKSGKITCLDCGHSLQRTFTSQGWHDEVIGQDCPNCKAKLEIQTTQTRVFKDEAYFTVLTTHKGLQVIRKYDVFGYYKSGRKANLNIREVSRIYITKEGKFAIIGYSFINNYYGERWFGTFDLKDNNTIGNHCFKTYFVYKRKTILPILKRNGFLGDTHTLTYFNFFYAILRNPKAETLLKAGQESLFIKSTDDYANKKVEKYWNSIKICLRQNYIVKEAGDWFDYLKLLEHFGRDLNNPKYVCPLHFKKEHDRYVEKKRKLDLKIRVSKMKKELIKDEREYKKSKKQYFNLSFTNGKITVKVIKTVKEVMNLGDMFKHCIYTNEYHKDMESLLLYATVNEEPMETVEFDLRSFKVVQSRGLHNVSTKFHSQIVKLVDENKNLIKRLAVSHKISA